MYATANEVSGFGLLFTNKEGQLCKIAQGQELTFYQKCRNEERFRPFEKIIPRMIRKYWLKLNF